MGKMIFVLAVLLVALGAAGAALVRTHHRVPIASAEAGAGTGAGDRAASYYLDLARLEERYQDLTAASDAYARALELATTPDQKLQGHLGLGRIKEARGDLKGAISELEAAYGARELMAKDTSHGPYMASGTGEGDDLLAHLGRLYMKAKWFGAAERLYEGALAERKTPPERDGILRLEIQLWQTEGSLGSHIDEKEAALTAPAPDETDLRFLALAYTGGMGIGLVTPGWASGGPQGDTLDKLTKVYERLYALHGNDLQLRQALVNLYEREGRIDDTIKLLRDSEGLTEQLAASQPAGAGQGCPMGLIPRPIPPRLQTEADIVRLLARAGRTKDVVDGIGNLEALYGTPQSFGVAAYVVAARLYLEQGKAEEAEAALVAGAKVGTAPADQRDIQIQQADVLQRAGKLDQLKTLYEQWARSTDPCLREDAPRRSAMIAEMLRVQRPAATSQPAH